MRQHRSFVRSRPSIIGAILAVSLFGLVAACTTKDDPKAPITNGAAATGPGSTVRSSGTSGTTRPASPGPSAPSKPDTVTIKDYTFTPSPLAVKAGATTTWVNLETDPPVDHWVKNDPGAAATFDSGKLAPDASYSFAFAAAGEYSYYCAIHDFMKGKVVVSP